MKCGVYKITNIVNGKILIGVSRDIYHRWSNYRSLLRYNKYQNAHLQRAWNKYGERNFIFETILLCPPEDFEKEETRLIKEYHSTDRSIGYNIESGGNVHNQSEEAKKKISDFNRGKILSDEHKRKISDASKGKNNPLYGKHHSVATKDKMSKARKGKKKGPMSEETKLKIAATKKGCVSPFLGKRHSEEAKRKISAAKKSST